MEKRLYYTGVLALLALIMAAGGAVVGDLTEVGGITEGVTVHINVYSGRSPPVWALSSEEKEGVRTLLDGLYSAEPMETPEWGYILVVNRDNDPSMPFHHMYLVSGTIILVDGDGGKAFRRDTKDLWTYLLSLGDKHDPFYVPPKSASLPPGVPYIAVVPASIEIEAGADGKAVTQLVVFNEGRGELSGSLSASKGIILDRNTIKLQPLKGEEYAFTVELDGATYDGEITIESNDPEKSIIRVPVRVETGGKVDKREIQENAEDSSDQLLPAILAVCGIIAIIVIYKKILGR